MTSYTFSQLIDFTRTTAATYVNSAGNIVSTPESVNLLTFTQEFANAAWGKTNSTVTANSIAAPDGTMTADTLAANAGSGIAPLVIQTGTTVTSSVYTASWFVRAGTHTFVQMYIGSQSADWCNFTLTGSGSVQNNGAAVGAISFNSATGYYRISMTYTAGGVDRRPGLALVPSGTASRVQTGTYAGTETIYIWGAQLELGSTATTYVRNFGGLFPARFDYDPVTLAPRGLLVEEQRTNLLLRSEEFDNASWTKAAATATANATTSPDGTVDADRLVPDTTNAGHQANQTATTTATATTFSIYAKPDGYNWIALGITDSGSTVRITYFNLATGAVGTVASGITASITPAGNGWYRCAVTVATALAGSNVLRVYVTNADNVTTYVGDGTSGIYVYGAQLEAGSFATSYIPTTASQVTRAADVPVIQAPNFAPWYNQSEGTFVVEASAFVPTSLATYRSLDATDGTSNNRIGAFVYNGKWGSTATVGGVFQYDLQQSSSYTANVTAKTAFAYKANDFAVSVNGNTALTDTVGTVPVVSQLNIGNTAAVNQLNGHIRSIRYYPTRLSNAQLQALSA